MKMVSVVLVIAFAAHPALAWNSTGHKAIALIAYQHLFPATKQRVDFLLAKHPDYPKWTEGVAPTDRGRIAFLEASVWPDAIRSDRRFHDDNRQPTPNIPGLPPGSQVRHLGWHFINLPFSPDGTPTVNAEEPNILTKLRDFEAIGSMPEPMQVYLLPWLLHLVGDVHQPLHVLNRFTRSHPQGDRGGNLVRLRGGNLHSYWDSRIGTGETDRFLTQLSEAIQRRRLKPDSIQMNPERWVQESFELRNQVYAFAGAGTEQDPAIYSDKYAVEARPNAFERAAMAGYRLAQFLNDRLR